MTATVYDTRRTINERGLRHAHPVVYPSLKLIVIIPPSRGIRLHRIHPIEEARDPFQFRRPLRLTDDSWIFAEIYVREESLTAFVVRSLAHIIVQLAEIAYARGLDYTTAPPAAAFQVSAAFRLAKEWGGRAWTGTIDATLTSVLPPSSFDANVIPARPTGIHVLQVRVHVDIVREWRKVAPTTLGGTPGICNIPTRCLWKLGLRRAEEFRRRTIPLRSSCASMAPLWSSSRNIWWEEGEIN